MRAGILSVRYFYIPFMGFTTVLIITLARIHNTYISKTRHIPFLVCLVFFIYSAQTYSLNRPRFKHLNNKKDIILQLMEKESIDKDTQIALVNIAGFTGGYFYWSTGFLQYILNNPDVSGIIGREFNFYDPFNKNHCSYSYKMSCIDSTKKLIAYKRDSNFNIRRYTYFLQWKDNFLV